MDRATGTPIRALLGGLALTALLVLAEVVTGLLAGSLALVSDAGHALTDSAGLLLALAAATAGRRPADVRRTYGYARYEVLVVPVQVVALFAIAGYIVYESVRRMSDGHTVHTGPVIAVGIGALVINLLVVRLLHGHRHNLNARAAIVEAGADAFGSAMVIVSAVLISFGAWGGLDALAGLGIAVFIVPRAVMLLHQSADILLESVPAGIDADAVMNAGREVPGVVDLHDLHIWAIAPHFPSLSAHVELVDAKQSEQILTDLTVLFRDRFGITHVTLQPETPEMHRAIECCLGPDAAKLETGTHSHTREAV